MSRTLLAAGGAPAPVLVTAPVATGSVIENGLVQTTTGVWIGAQSYTYQWQRASVDIAAATAFQYTTIAADCVILGVRSGVVAWSGLGGTGTPSVVSYSNVLVFTPLNIPGVRGYYDAALGIVLVGADVTSWADQSGVGNHLTDQGVAARRPLFIASAINGQPAVQFNGVAEVLTRLTFSFGATSNPSSFVAVYRADAFTNARNIIAYGAATGRPLLATSGGPATALVGYFASAAVQSLGTTVQGGGNFFLVFGKWNGATQYTGSRGVVEDSDANAGAATADNLAMDVGASVTYGGYSPQTLAELFIANANITQGDLDSYNVYKVSRYGGT